VISPRAAPGNRGWTSWGPHRRDADLLPKSHGSRGKLEDPLKRVLAWCLALDAPDHETVDERLREEQDANAAIEALEDLSYRYACTAAKCRRMLWHLYTSGFASFS
jgi:hypothetical protein